MHPWAPVKSWVAQVWLKSHAEEVPYMLIRTQDRWMSRSVHMSDCLTFHIVVSDVCRNGTSIIVNQNKFWTQGTPIWLHKLIENLIAIPQGCQCSIFNNLQVSFSIDDNACPNHNWALAISVMFCHINFIKSLFRHSPHQLTSISKIKIESGLISE